MDNLTFFFLIIQAVAAPYTTSNFSSESPAADNYVLVNNVVSKNTPHAEIDSTAFLYKAIGLAKYDLSLEVFTYALTGYHKLDQQGRLGNKKILSIIDFTKSSSKKRFYTIDLANFKLIFHTYVSHGKNTGEDKATSFSNVMHSNQSSLGFYVTAETYIGSKGYSLKLDGMERGYNDLMRERAVVMHNADYVSESWIRKYGRLGRSQGCPALPQEIGKKIIDTVKDGTVIFGYFDDHRYLAASPYLANDNFVAKATRERLQPASF
ncbi:MAG: murein L,D-transpeptidase catalytic domain family protein [Chryseolinea sp.]